MKKNYLTGWLLSLTLFTGRAALAQQYDGLTYYSNMNSAVGYLIDTNSTVVKTYNFSGNTGYATHFTPGGNFFRTVMNTGNSINGGGVTGRIQKLDYNGSILWDYTYSSSTYVLHHDHCPLPNGNVLVISYDVKTSTELAAAGGTANLSSIRSEKIMELQPVGTNSAIVVWQWNLWDHLVQNTDASKNNYQTSIVDHPELLNINYQPTQDWVHMNGLDYNPVLDQIAFSSHALNEWYIIDHSTSTAEAASHSGGNAGKGGDILYRWGNPAAYQASGTKILNVTHDSHWVPEGCPDAGYLTGVNNAGQTSPSQKTTFEKISLPRVDYNYTITPGSAYTPSTYNSRIVGTGYTSNMGNIQQFPNGNQLICLATAGTIYEINASGTTLWTKSTSGTCPQTERQTLCFLTNPAPAQPTVTSNGTVLTTASAATYQWYMNGNAIAGATLQSFTPSQSGIYVVRTTDTNGCVYVYSSGYKYTAASTTGLNANDLNRLVALYPNPVENVLNIGVSSELNNYFVAIKDVSGKIIEAQRNATSVDMNELPAGLYFIEISLESGQSITKKVIHTK